MMENVDARDLVLPNNSYAHVLDETKGNITCYVGPIKVQLAGTDMLVIFDPESKTYRRTNQQEAVRQILVAPEGWYTILKNPAKDEVQPAASSSDSISIDRLNVGRKIHIPGPISFALWPGQMAEVVQGHRLRSNQYLIVRVYDAEAAKQNWENTIIQKTSISEESTNDSDDVDLDKDKDKDEDVIGSDKEEVLTEESILDTGIDFTVGKLMIVKGTEVSFFIPPTGIEVVKDASGSYIREAVTLERLIYCILLDESGSKRYIRGPAVVFPRPTEVFQTQRVNGKLTRRFRAIELNELSGIYVKVIAAYKENGVSYKEGQELFITGKEQAIYYRRDEHQLIKYGDKEIHYATAVPKGEAIYVLQRLTGDIKMIEGPAMCLPDPRKEVIVRRILPIELAKLMYPGNDDVIRYNSNLQEMLGDPSMIDTDSNYSASVVPEMAVSFRNASENDMSYACTSETTKSDGHKQSLRSANAGVFEKLSTYTKPRTVTLDTKYNGAVNIKVWTGYAIIVVNGLGVRKVIEGPATYNLEYDEYPEVIVMSTGKPKNTDRLVKDIYLRTKNNKVADIITVETKDLVDVSMKLSYRINFIDDSDKWFNVENYVKFLCDHMRSRLKGFAQTISLKEFYSDSVNMIRNVVLGEKSENNERGYLFKENNMFVADVEVLKVTINDADIANNIIDTQQDIVTATIKTARKSELLELKRQEFDIESEELELQKKSMLAAAHVDKLRSDILTTQNEQTHEMELRRTQNDAIIRLKEIENEQSCVNVRDDNELLRQDKLSEIAKAKLSRREAEISVDISEKEQIVDIIANRLSIESKAVVDQLNAIQPGLIEALQANAQVSVVKDIMPGAIPLSIVEGKSVGTTIAELFNGTPVGQVLDNATHKIKDISIDEDD